MVPLGLLGSGEQGEIVEIREHLKSEPHGRRGHRWGSRQSRAEDLGVRVGKNIEMLTNEGCGPLLVRIDESRIAMARGLAMKVLVRRKET